MAPAPGMWPGRVHASGAGLSELRGHCRHHGGLPGVPVNGQVCGCRLAFLDFVNGGVTGAWFLPVCRFSQDLATSPCPPTPPLPPRQSCAFGVPQFKLVWSCFSRRVPVGQELPGLPLYAGGFQCSLHAFVLTVTSGFRDRLFSIRCYWSNVF